MSSQVARAKSLKVKVAVMMKNMEMITSKMMKVPVSLMSFNT